MVVEHFTSGDRANFEPAMPFAYLGYGREVSDNLAEAGLAIQG